MRTVSYFEHKGRTVRIYKFTKIGAHLNGYTYRASLDGQELPVSWPCARSLELAIKKLLDEEESLK
jgi:hypothetical protein